jgi:hypothetical protein
MDGLKLTNRSKDNQTGDVRHARSGGDLRDQLGTSLFPTTKLSSLISNNQN